jgi:ligand-binding sensor domain-containing protein
MKQLLQLHLLLGTGRWLIITGAAFVMTILMTSPSAAQQYPFRIYSMEQGLAGAEVQDIIQDQQGFLWFATSNGVSKFDGRRFTSITEDDGLIDNNVVKLYEDFAGRIWCATQGRGVIRINDTTAVQLTRRDGLGTNQVRTIAIDHKGIVWFGGLEGGVTRYDGESLAVFGLGDGLPHMNVTSLAQSADGTLWAGTQQGLARWTGTQFEPYILTGLVQRPREPIISEILPEQDGSIFVAYRTPGALGSGIIRIDNLQAEKVETEMGFGFMRIFRDRHHNFWLTTANRGVFKIDGAERQQITTEQGLPGNRVQAVYEDREGNLWFGTAGSGVAKLTSEAFVNYPVGNVRSLLEDKAGNIWGGMGPEGIISLSQPDTRLSEMGGFILLEDSRGNMWTIQRMSFTRSNGSEIKEFPIPRQASPVNMTGGARLFWQALEDVRGDIWIGNMAGGGIFRIVGDTVHHYDESSGLTGTSVTALHQDSKGNVWIGTNAGLNRWTGTTLEKIERGMRGARGGRGGREGRAGRSMGIGIRAVGFLEDSRGHLWTGSFGFGITRFDGIEFSVFGMEQGLRGRQLVPLIEDRQGHVWILTADGFSEYDGEAFRNHPMEHDLFSRDMRFGLVHDGKAYIGTNAGIVRFDPETVSLREFTSRDGLISNVMNPGATLVDSDGNIWFGTPNGASRYTPGQERTSNVAPPVFIRWIQSANESLPVDAPVKLRYNRNTLRIAFTGLSFTNPEAVQYRYRMEGLEDDWTETPDPTVLYSYLPPGEYRFTVEARSSNGIWSDDPATLSVTILPPFWATWWFRIIAVLLIIGLIWNWRQRELQALLNRQRDQQRAQELSTAYNIQVALLPRHAPSVSGYDIAGTSLPAQSVGGDYYDFIPVDDGRWALCLGDITGKGLPAAMLMANLQGIIRGQSQLHGTTQDCLHQANKLLFRSTESSHFATFFYGMLDVQNHQLQYTNAGHNPPMKFGHNGDPELLTAGGPVLGFMENVAFEQSAIALQPQELVVMYSDGVTEAMNAAENEFDESRLINVIQEHRGQESGMLVEKVVQEVQRYAGGTPQSDDITLLVLQRT